MRKIIFLAILIIVLSAGMANAVSWTSTSFLTAPDIDDTVARYYAVQLDVVVSPDGVDPAKWDYVYTLTNDAGASGYHDYEEPIDRFTISNPGNLVPADINVYDVPSGWKSEIDGKILWWDAETEGDRIAAHSSQTFKYWSYKGPWQRTATAAIDGRSFNGQTKVPTPVPEASTLVGFGSALMIGAPGMLGWIRRRRS